MADGSEFPAVTDRVTQDTIDAYADLSGDYNPLHVDAEHVGERRRLGLAQLRELGRDVRHRAVVLTQLLTGADVP